MNIPDDAILHVGPGGRIYDADGVDVTYELNRDPLPGQYNITPWDAHTLKLGGWGTTTTANNYVFDDLTIHYVDDNNAVVQPWSDNLNTISYTSSSTNVSMFPTVDNNTITYQASVPVTKSMMDEALEKKKNKSNKVGKDWSYKYNNTYK